MASGSNSGVSNGNQTTTNNAALKEQVAKNEKLFSENYVKEVLPQSSPLKIPKSATVSQQKKDGYDQVKYSWFRGKYKYISRWHTRTPNAPADQGNTWVAERRKPGIGYGPNARKAVNEVLVGKNKWVSKKEWNAAVYANKKGTATEKQKEMLKNGHWKA